MSTYKNIFVSDEYDGLEAGAQIQSIDGSVKIFGESAFASLEDAVSASVSNAVIRVASGKYEGTDGDGSIAFYVADSKGNVRAVDQVVFVNFDGGKGLSYDNGAYSRTVDMDASTYTSSEKTEIVDALNDRNAADGIVFTADAAVAAAVAAHSTIHVGSTDDFDDLGTFKGLSETVDTDNQIADDEAFVNTDNISSVEDAIEVIDHEAGHLTGEAHEETTGTIEDYANPVPTTELSYYVNSAWTDQAAFDDWYTAEKQAQYPGLAYGTNAFQTVKAAVDAAGGAAVSLDIIATSNSTSSTNPNAYDCLVVNSTTNDNITSVIVEEGAVLFVGAATQMNKVDISRFHGAGMVAAYGMVEIDKSAIAEDFTGTIGCVGSVTGQCSFVSSITGADSYLNLNNNGAAVYAFSKGLTIGNGATLTGDEKLVINVGDAEFFQTGENQSGGNLSIEKGNVIGTAGKTAMEVNITNVKAYSSPSTALATLDGDVTGDVKINVTNAGMSRTATFVANSGDRTYNTNLTAVVDNSQFYQTSGGVYSKKGYLTASMWNAGAGTVTQVGNVNYTVQNLDYASDAVTTIYGLYTAGSGISAVNGNIDMTFTNNTAAGVSFYGVNNAGSTADQAILTGNLSVSVNNSTMGSFYGAVNGTISGDYTVTVTDSTAKNYAVLNGAVASITGASSITFNGTDTVTQISGFDNVTISAGATVNTTYVYTKDFASSWSNSGTLTVDMTGATASSYKLVDYTGTGTMTLADYGNVVLSNNEQGLELFVIDNDLYAGKAVAQIGDVKYATLSDAYAAAESGDTIKLLVDTIDNINGLPEGVTLEGVAGKTTVTGTDVFYHEDLGGCTIKNLKFAGNGDAIRFAYCGADKTFTIDNCDFTPQGEGSYSIHFDGSAKGSVVIKNSYCTNWSAFAESLESVKFENCVMDVIGSGTSYNCIRNYGFIQFSGCKFTEAFADQADKNGILLDGPAELIGCSVIKSKDDQTVSETKTLINSIRMNLVKDDGFAAIADTEEAFGKVEGKYTAGTFVAKDKTVFKTYVASSVAIDWIGDSKTFVYDTTSNAASVYESLAGTVNVPDGVTFSVASGITYGDDAKLTGNVNYDIADAKGAVEINNATVSGNITESQSAAALGNVVTLTGTDTVSGKIDLHGICTDDLTESIYVGVKGGDAETSATADVTVTGILRTLDGFWVGSDGVAMAATKDASQFKLTVSGANAVAGSTSNLFYEAGSGYILVEDGATLVGPDSSVHGYVELTGEGTTADFGYMRFNGETGTRAQMTISAGAVFDNAWTFAIGHESSANRYADVTITGAGSTLDTGALHIYAVGDGASTLTLTDGATVTVSTKNDQTGILTNDGVISMDSSSLITAYGLTNNGTISVDMTDATASSYKLIDYTGSGTMTLADYGTVNLTGTGADNYALYVQDNDLYVGAQYVAKVGDQYFSNVRSAVIYAADQGTASTVELLTSSTRNVVPATNAVALKNDVTLSGADLTTLYTATGTTPGKGTWDFYADTTTENDYTVTIDANTKIVMKSDASGLGTTMTLRFGDDEPVEGAANKNVLTVNVNGDIEADQLSFGDFSDVTMGSMAEVDTKAMFQIRGNFEVNGSNGNWSADNPQFEVGTYMNVRSKTTTGRDEQRTATFKNTFIKIGPSSNMLDNLNLSNSGNLVLDNTGVSIANALEMKDNSTVTLKNGSTVTADGHYTNGDHTSTITVGSTLNILTGSSLTFANDVENAGSIVMDASGALLSYGGTFSNTGTITVDVTDAMTPLFKVVDYTGTGSASEYGTVNFTGTGADNYETKLQDGDLWIQKKDTSISEAAETHTGAGQDDVTIQQNTGSSSEIATSDGTTASGSVTVTNSGDGAVMVDTVTAGTDATVTNGDGTTAGTVFVSEVNASGKATIETQASDVTGGNVSVEEVTAETVDIIHAGANTLNVTKSITATATEGVGAKIENITKDADLSIAANVYVEGATLEIRNETNMGLNASGKLKVKDINVYNNEADTSKTGVINLTNTIEAAGSINIYNNAAGAASGAIHLGENINTAAEDLTINNATENIINGSGTIGDETAAKFAVEGNATITNAGHVNAEVVAAGDVSITNTSVNTLIGDYTGANVNVTNQGGAAHDVELTATDGNIVVTNNTGAESGSGEIDNLTANAANGYVSISGNGTTTNAVINADTLYMGGTSVELTGGTILDEGSNIYIQYANEAAFPETPVDGAVLTITGDKTVGANIVADTLEGTLYGTVKMNGTQTYTGAVAGKTISIESGADVTMSSLTFDFGTLAIAGKLNIDYDTLDSYTEAGTVNGAGTLNITNAGTWIVNDSVYRDFSGFAGTVTMTDSTKIVMGIGDAPTDTALTAAQSYMGDNSTMVVNGNSEVYLSGDGVTTGIKFTGAGTVYAGEYDRETGALSLLGSSDFTQTLSDDNSGFTGTMNVGEGATVTLEGNFGGNVNLDHNGAIPALAATTLKLNAADIEVKGTITGDNGSASESYADIIDVDESATLSAEGALDAFAGNVDVASAKTMTLTQSNDTAAKFTGAGTVDGSAADQTLSSDAAIDNFTGTIEVGANTLTLKGTNSTAALFDGTGSIVANTADKSQTLTADAALNNFSGSVTLGADTLTLDGTNSTAATFSGTGLIDANDDQTLTAEGALNNFSGTVALEGNEIELDAVNTTAAKFTGTQDAVIDADAKQTLTAEGALNDFSGTVELEGNEIELDAINTTAAKFTGTTAAVINADAKQTLTLEGAINDFHGTVALEGNELELTGANTTDAKVTGTNLITAKADQTFSGDVSGFSGTIDANGTSVVTLSGTVADTLNLKGNEVVLDDAVAHTGAIGINANTELAALTTNDNAVDVKSGTVTAVTADEGDVTVSGATVATVTTDEGDVAVSAGTVGTVTTAGAASGEGDVTVSGGTVTTINTAAGDVAVSGGTVTNITTTGATAGLGDVTLTGGTVTNVTTAAGNIDLTAYTGNATAFETLTTASGTIKLNSDKPITVSGTLDGDMDYTVANDEFTAAGMHYTGDSALSYTDAITVTAAANYFDSGYTLIDTDNGLTLASDYSITLTVGSDSGTIKVGQAAKIGGTFYQLSLVDGKDLVLKALNTSSDKVYVNENWTAEPYAEVTDNYYNPAQSVTRNVGYDAAVSITKAVEYVVAKNNAGTIELTENKTYATGGTALGTEDNGVTNMTLQSRSNNPTTTYNAKVTGDIKAGTATTLNLSHLTATGSVYGAGTVNITGTKINRFSGTYIAAGGNLNITGGTYTSRYIAGGSLNAAATAATSVTITGNNDENDRTSISGSIYGGNVVTSGSVTQTEAASVTVDTADDKKVYIAGNIYAAGLRRGGSLTVSGNRTVTFTGDGDNLSFTGRVSGGAQGTATVTGTADLTFQDFSGKFNGSISDFNTMTLSGNTSLSLGRRQTLTSNTNLTFSVTGTTSSAADTAMYTVRDQNSWEFGKSITVTAVADGTASGTYTLVGNCATGFEDFTFTVAGQSATLGQTITVGTTEHYTLNYVNNKLTLTYLNEAESLVVNDTSAKTVDADDKYILYTTDVNGAELNGVKEQDKISAKAGTTVIFNDATNADNLDENANGVLLYKEDNTNDIKWVGNGETANVTGGLSGNNIDISGKTLNVDTANITTVNVTKDAELNLTSGTSSISEIAVSNNANLTLDVGTGATISGNTISGSAATVTVSNAGTLSTSITDAGKVVISSNTSFNSLHGTYGGANTTSVTVESNTGKVSDAAFQGTTVTLSNEAQGYYENITVTATSLNLTADFDGGRTASQAVYSFAGTTETAVSTLALTNIADLAEGAYTVVANGDLTNTAITIDGEAYTLGTSLTIGEYNYTLDASGVLSVLKPCTDTDFLVNASYSGMEKYTKVAEGYYVGVNAFGTMAEATAAASTTEETTITVAGTDAIVSASSIGGGQDIVITGTAPFNWSDWMMVGRDAGEHGDVTKLAKVTFDDATITGAGFGGGDCSIHISGAEADSSSKGYGQMDVVNNSSIETAWVIDKNVLNVNTGSTFQARQLLNVAGRPASETPSGEDYEAVLNVDAATVKAHGSSNGSGLIIGNEGKGTVNLTNGAVLEASTINATSKSTINVTDSTVTVGGTFANAGAFTNNGTVNVSGTSKISATNYVGNMNVGSTTAATTLTTDGLTQKQASGNDIKITDGSTVTLSGNGFDLYYIEDSEGIYNDAAHTGYTLNIQDADSFEVYAIYANGGSTVNVSDVDYLDATYLNVYGGTINLNGGTTTNESVNVTGTINVNNATLDDVCWFNIYKGVDGKQGGTANITNSTVSFGYNSQLTLALRVGTVTKSDGKYYVDGDDQTAKLNLVNSTITVTDIVENAGAITMDYASAISTAKSFSGTNGTITVDMTGADKVMYKLIDASAASDYGTCQFATGKDNGYTLSVQDNDLYAIKTDVNYITVDSTVEEVEGTDGNDIIRVTSTGRVTDTTSYALDTKKGSDAVVVEGGAYVGGLGLGLGVKDVSIEAGAQVLRLAVCGNGYGTEEKTTATIVSAGNIGSVQTSNYIDTYTLTNNGTIGGDSDGAYVKLDSGDSTIVNNGTINAVVYTEYDSWSQICSSVTVVNNGTIDNAAYLKYMYTPAGEHAGFTAPMINTVQTDLKDDSLTNNGTIVGSVDLGDGDNTVTLGKGSQITAQIASEDMTYETFSQNYSWAKGTEVTDGGVTTGSGADVLTMDVDSVLAGAVDLGEGVDIVNVTGITSLTTDIAGAKKVSGQVSNAETFKVDDVDMVLGEAKQIAGADTLDDASDDVWAQLSNGTDGLIVSWGKSESAVATAVTALDEQKAEMQIGQAVTAEIADPTKADFTKKNNGTLA